MQGGPAGLGDGAEHARRLGARRGRPAALRLDDDAGQSVRQHVVHVVADALALLVGGEPRPGVRVAFGQRRPELGGADGLAAAPFAQTGRPRDREAHGHERDDHADGSRRAQLPAGEGARGEDDHDARAEGEPDVPEPVRGVGGDGVGRHQEHDVTREQERARREHVRRRDRRSQQRGGDGPRVAHRERERHEGRPDPVGLAQDAHDGAQDYRSARDDLVALRAQTPPSHHVLRLAGRTRPAAGGRPPPGPPSAGHPGRGLRRWAEGTAADVIGSHDALGRKPLGT